MTLFCKLKNGKAFVVANDNVIERNMCLIPIEQTDENGYYDKRGHVMKSNVKMTASVMGLTR